MPELLDPTSRITALCRERGITIALMTDARFSGGSVGLVIGHVAPEAILGGPIALVEDGDAVVVDITTDRIECGELQDADVYEARAGAWRARAEANGGVHPDAVVVTDRVLGSHARHRAAGPPRWWHGHAVAELSRLGADRPGVHAGGFATRQARRAPQRGAARCPAGGREPPTSGPGLFHAGGHVRMLS